MNANPCNHRDVRTDGVAVGPDELAIRRERKRLGWLTPSQVQRLIIAAELRRKATQGERDD